MNNVLQISYWTVGGFEGKKPIRQAIKEVKELGFDGLELTFGAGEFVPGISREECLEIKKFANDSGVRIETCASGAYWDLSLGSADSSERAKAVEFTTDYLKAAGWIGAGVCLVIPGAVFVGWDPSKPVTPYSKVWDFSTESLKKLLPVAEDTGVVIGLENVWNGFLTDPIAMKTFIEQFQSGRIGSYFDIANCVINGFPEHWIQILGSRIAAVHVKNFSREDAGGLLHGFGDDLTAGDVNFNAVIDELEKINYKGALTAEMIPFSRLPDMVLPDMELAADTAVKMKNIFRG